MSRVFETLVAQRFEIEATAGRGGMGTVFQAHDRHSGRKVALKLLNAEQISEEVFERFLREARVLAELQDPHIVRYIEHGRTAEGRPFLVMEWLSGEDLAQRLRRGRLTIAESIVLLKRTAGALAIAHRRGIVHRDLKPGNLFLRAGQLEAVTLLDFGIARQFTDAQVRTRTGVVIGTIDYMAPEQARGQRDVGKAADIFSLGCVLFECLVGQPPFSSENVIGSFAKILFEEAPLLRSVRAEVAEDLETLLARMLNKDPQQRPQDADALLVELIALSEAPPEAPPAVSTISVPRREITVGEQRLVSVVVAAPQHPPEAAEQTLAPAELEQSNHRNRTLREELVRFGARVEFIADGSLVATLMQVGSATDQASQAARCALALHQRWPGARIALATGRALMHEALPMGEAIDRAVQLLRHTTTPPPELATAAAGVRIDEVSGGLLDSRFTVLRTSGLLILQSENVSEDETRLLLGKPTPCVGREQELMTLAAVLTACIEESQARVVLITAPPGMGKSRLRHEFLRRQRQQSPAVEVLFGRGDQMTAGSPYGILGDALRRRCDICAGEPLEAQQVKLAARLRQRLPPDSAPRIVAFLGELCRVPFPEADNVLLRAARQDPKIMSEQVSLAFVAWLQNECAAAPQLVVLEDLHWGDLLTIRLIDTALRELSALPLMCVALARPEVVELFPKLWAERGQLELRLNALGKKAGERLVQQVLGKQISPKTMERIIEHAAGNALYLEELIRAVAEGKGEALPETVLAMLQTRLLRLPPGERRLLRAASIFGETFWRGGLLELLGHERATDEVDAWLQKLIDAELIQLHNDSRFPGEKEYAFLHALVRDAAYSMFTAADQKLGHALASLYLERMGERDPLLLAEHAQRGGDLPRALPLYLRAAEQSFERNDFDGVKARAARALACGARDHELGTVRALQFLAAFWSGEMSTAFSVGREALQLLPKGSLWWCKTITNLFVVTSHQAQPDALNELVQLFATAAPSDDARGAYVEAASWLITMFSYLGLREPASRFVAPMLQAAAPILAQDANTRGFANNARSWFLRILAPEPYTALLYAQQSVEAFTRGQNHRNMLVGQLAIGLGLGELGDWDAGERVFRDSLELTERLRDTFMIANVRVYLGMLLAHRGERQQQPEARLLATQVLEANVSPIYSGMSRMVLAQCLLTLGELDQAESEARQSITMLQMMRPYALMAMTTLLHVLLRKGQVTEARKLAADALQIITEQGGAGSIEVRARLAIAKTYHAAGELASAQHAIGEARHQVELRLANIPDPVIQHSFVAAVPENAQTLALAQDWLGITTAA